jgi:amidohydrolase
MGHKEFKAVKVLTEELSKHGFAVEKGIADLKTAFKAEYKGIEEGPIVGILAEYDALPMGHACGHNIIGAAAIGAGIALSRVMNQLPGKLIIYGTPAEETDGAKVTMCEKGVFDEIDMAMMIHPGDRNVVKNKSLAMDAIEFVYHGRAAHAAAAPHEGINALDGVIMLFNSINALRQQLKDDVRIHGIITEGGVAPNIIPEKAVARFYIRAAERSYLDEVVQKVNKCAEGAAISTGCRLEHSNFELSFDNLVTNTVLAEVFENNLRELGEPLDEAREMMGSTDMGNVSHVVPAIHPYIAIGDKGLPGHTKEFLEAAGSSRGHKGLIIGAKVLAMTAVDLLAGPEIIKKAKEEFNRLNDF